MITGVTIISWKGQRRVYNNLHGYSGCYPLERPVTAIRGAICGRYESRDDTVVDIRKPVQSMGGTRAGATYGSHSGTGTDSASTDGQSREGSDGRSGVWRKSSMSEE